MHRAFNRNRTPGHMQHPCVAAVVRFVHRPAKVCHKPTGHEFLVNAWRRSAPGAQSTFDISGPQVADLSGWPLPASPVLRVGFRYQLYRGSYKTF